LKNTVTESFSTTVRQMTEMSQRKKNSVKTLHAIVLQFLAVSLLSWSAE